MFAAYLLLFCRISIALLFIFSAASKALALKDFEVTVDRFKLLPRHWNKAAARLFLGGEIVTVILIVIGGSVLLVGLLLAIALLALFAIALLSALSRGIDTSCNCFGKSERRISPYDVVRNVLFILCSLSGLWLLRYTPQHLEASEVALLTYMSAAFVLLAANLSDIIETLLRPFSIDAN
jgi:uncharacterized membrane protein YphA (DoxX/SURF4 family)